MAPNNFFALFHLSLESGIMLRQLANFKLRHPTSLIVIRIVATSTDYSRRPARFDSPLQHRMYIGREQNK
jgi:hypothetical protein